VSLNHASGIRLPIWHERNRLRRINTQLNNYRSPDGKEFYSASISPMNNILYDRSASGEFFQVYTDFFEDRFYFEIVERRGDYVGFGAVNAPVRLAAQDEAYRRSLIDSEESY
jgi:hypothetical protein